MLPQFGKILIVVGAVILVVGLIFLFGSRIPFLGKLPGDFSFRKGNWSLYFPLATCLILSVLLTILLNLFGRGK